MYRLSLIVTAYYWPDQLRRARLEQSLTMDA